MGLSLKSYRQLIGMYKTLTFGVVPFDFSGIISRLSSLRLQHQQAQNLTGKLKTRLWVSHYSLCAVLILPVPSESGWHRIPMFAGDSDLISCRRKSIHINRYMTQLCSVNWHWQIFMSAKNHIVKANAITQQWPVKRFSSWDNDTFKTCAVLEAKHKVLNVYNVRR